MIRRAAVVAAAALALGARAARAQYGYFGENKVQFKEFDWRVIQGPHVDLHYYPAEEELARVALSYAEESYTALAHRFNHEVGHRVPLIVYASHTDFEQTNILPYVPPEGLLGVTDFAKERVTLPFTGNYYDFKHTIRHEMVHVFQLSVEEQTYRRYPREHHAALPLWWTEGLAEFFSIGTDNQGEMLLRELTVTGQLPTIPQLTYASGGAIYPIGAKIHQFLAEKYGEWRILEVYDQTWKYETFEQLIQGVYGESLQHISEEWRYWMRQHYYPAVQDARPLALDSRPIADLAIKPAVVRDSTDSTTRVLYFSPADGYTDIYSALLNGGKRRVVVKGERTPEFESFHLFDSRLDVQGRRLAFTSKYLDRDALFIWDLRRGRMLGRFQFPELVGILSPTWTPDGQSIVFSGLADDGYSDLYRVWIADGRLERLTHDRYQDVDPTVSPDGRTVVFSSDRTSFGASGAKNLFRLDLASGAISYLTYGNWKDSGPRWDRTTGRIWFSSDRDGTQQVYEIDSTGTGRRVTDVIGGAFDPEYIPWDSTIVFSGFADLTFGVYRTRVSTDTAALGPAVSLAAHPQPANWSWPELETVATAAEHSQPYRQRFTLDFAAGDAIVVPGLGAAQGADFLFSDLLEDHLMLLELSSFQGSGLGNFFGNINGTLLYLNQAHRINWGVGVFRLRGEFFEGDLSTVYDETSTGALAQLRYPFDRFRRLELEYRLEHSDRFDVGNIDVVTGGDPTALHRVGWLSSEYLSYVKDNSLWLDTGPIDGERYTVTGGVVNDVSHGRFDSWVGFLDYRRYLRTSLRSGFAFRALGYYGGGERPRRINIGGSWGLRGYPYYGFVAGTRAWMLNLEWRFPITDYIDLGFPFGPLRFPGVQGAFFIDDARAWTALTDGRGTLGSSGLGLRMPIGPAFVLRLDMGWRFSSGNTSLYSLPSSDQGRRFVDLFFGFNY